MRRLFTVLSLAGLALAGPLAVLASASDSWSGLVR